MQVSPASTGGCHMFARSSAKQPTLLHHGQVPLQLGVAAPRLAAARFKRWSVPVDERPVDASHPPEGSVIASIQRQLKAYSLNSALSSTDSDTQQQEQHQLPVHGHAVNGHHGYTVLNGHADTTSSSLEAHTNGIHSHTQLDVHANEANEHSAHGVPHLNGHAHGNSSLLNGHAGSCGSHLKGHVNGANGHLNGHANGSSYTNGVAHAHGSLNGTLHAVHVVAVNGVAAKDALSDLLNSHGSIDSGESSTEGTAQQERLSSHHHASSSTQEPTPITSQPVIAQAQAPTSSSSGAATSTHAPEIPRPILVISLVSASLTMASCVFNTLLPVYMVTELKMNMRSMGMFEGFLEAFSYIVRMFSGVVSDMMTSRKSAITLGFAMGAMAKFGMSGAGTVGQLFASKAVDRLANGVQAAPRDALISDLAPAASRSACFGFAQSMRKWGSFIGACMSFVLMRASGNDYKLIFLMAASVTVASTLAFVLLVPSHARPLTPEQQKDADEHAAYKVKQAAYEASLQQTSVSVTAGGQAPAAALQPPTPPKPKAGFKPAKLLKDALSMGSDFYRMLGVVSLYGLGHINESMLEARAIEVGFGKAESTLVVALMALAVSISAWPLGKLDDKHGPRTTFAVGMSALIAGNLVLMLSGPHPWAVFGSCIMLGVHCAVIQGPLLSIVVSLAPAHLRGTAFGIFYTVMALVTVAANSVYGTVWHTMGATSAFSLSASLMCFALLALPHLLPKAAMRGRQQPAVVAATTQHGPAVAPA